jgi:hypothetical protein
MQRVKRNAIAISFGGRGWRDLRYFPRHSDTFSCSTFLDGCTMAFDHSLDHVSLGGKTRGGFGLPTCAAVFPHFDKRGSEATVRFSAEQGYAALKQSGYGIGAISYDSSFQSSEQRPGNGGQNAGKGDALEGSLR